MKKGKEREIWQKLLSHIMSVGKLETPLKSSVYSWQSISIQHKQQFTKHYITSVQITDNAWTRRWTWTSDSSRVELGESRWSVRLGEVYIKSLRLKFISRDPALLQFPESCTLFHHCFSAIWSESRVKQTLVTRSRLNVSGLSTLISVARF